LIAAHLLIWPKYGDNSALHADTARWFSVLQRADIALLLEML
jgi:hypothetical protein